MSAGVTRDRNTRTTPFGSRVLVFGQVRLFVFRFRRGGAKRYIAPVHLLV